jgi:hypothetical protein
MIPLRVGVALLMAGFVFLGCSDSAKKPDQPGQKSSGNPLTAPVDYLDAAARAKKKAVNTVDQVGMDQSIQLFYAQEGRYPKSLNELVRPDYLSRLPDPPPGMKFNYDPATGKFSIVPQ